jgi:uncharacterized protein (TIGR03435 family)
MQYHRSQILILAALSAGTMLAQDITGTWQGKLVLPTKQELRTVIKISKEAAGLKAVFYSIDQTPQPIAATIALAGSIVTLTVPAGAIKYEGKLDSDAVTLTGTFKQGDGQGVPLSFAKTGPKNPEWPMPDAAARPKPMATDADPEFDVCTIKPSNPAVQGRGLTMRGREVVTINTPAKFLMTFVYGVHANQLVGAPSWFDSDGYDLDGKPAQDGLPNQNQIKTMIRKLLADRFQLKFHREQRELSVYAIQVGKNGPKMMVSQADPKSLPGLGFRALGAMNAQNATMADLASLFQTAVLDRPVVDQTGLVGHFDFQLNWTPDESQFSGMGVRVPPPSDKPDAPPGLAIALQDQLGLKLTATKTMVDVLVIDKVEKPSAN